MRLIAIFFTRRPKRPLEPGKGRSKNRVSRIEAGLKIA
jgi:hypothetical protein